VNIIAKKSALISIPVKAGQKKYTFGTQSVLSRKKLKHLICYAESATTPDDTSALATLNGVYVSLVNSSKEVAHDNVPARLLSMDQTNPIEFDTTDISWESSSVLIPDPSAIPAGSSLVFLAIYE
jgi:hypothetical protein